MKTTSNLEVSNAAVSSVIPHPSSFHRILWRLVEVVIGGLFIYAGAIKALDPVTFGRDIGNYQILAWQAGLGLALYLPWLEIFSGLALITRVFYRAGVFVLTGLMSIFIIATIIAKARGLDVSCGCFGHASENLSFTSHLVLDFILLAGLFSLLFRQRLSARS